jgi:hypothetical protein
MKNHWIAGAMILIGFASALAGCADRHGGARVDSGSVVIGNEDAHVRVVFGDRDTLIIRDYYAREGKGNKKKGLPPGLAKRETLQPGLQKRIDRGQPLPPGLQARLLPYELEERLSPLPRGYIRIKTGGQVAIKDVIADIIVDVIAVMD